MKKEIACQRIVRLIKNNSVPEELFDERLRLHTHTDRLKANQLSFFFSFLFFFFFERDYRFHLILEMVDAGNLWVVLFLLGVIVIVLKEVVGHNNNIWQNNE